jgi:hypothetical protein
MLRSVLLASAAALAGLQPAAALEPADGSVVANLEFLGEVFIPLGHEVAGTRVLGLSGRLRLGETDTYVAICDDTNSPARFYTLTIDLSDGSLDEGDVTVDDVTLLGGPQGPLEIGTFDLEGLALDPGAATLLVASEGRGDGPADAHAPFLYRYSRDGAFVGALALPGRYDQTVTAGHGVYNSGGFESLVYSPDFDTLWMAAETALQQDGPKPTLEEPAHLRIMRWDSRDAGRPVLTAEYVYELSAREGSTILEADEGGDRSMVDLLPVTDTVLFALEREWIGGEPRTNTRPIALYEIDTANADDVSGVESLSGAETPVDRRLVLDFESVRAAGHVERVGSFETVIFGPTLEDGRRTLIFVEDNDDGVDTQIIVFGVTMR